MINQLLLLIFLHFLCLPPSALIQMSRTGVWEKIQVISARSHRILWGRFPASFAGFLVGEIKMHNHFGAKIRQVRGSAGRGKRNNVGWTGTWANSWMKIKLQDIPENKNKPLLQMSLVSTMGEWRKITRTATKSHWMLC